MTAFILAFITSLILLSAKRQSARWKLFLLQFAIVFVLMVAKAILSDINGGDFSELHINYRVIPYKVSYYGTQWFIYSLVAFGIATFFIKKEEVANPNLDPSIKDNYESKEGNTEIEIKENTELITPSGNIFKFNSSQESEIKEHPEIETKLLSSAPESIIQESPAESDEQSSNLLEENKQTIPVFEKKKISFLENLQTPQKIIFSVSSIAISFVICYVFAQSIDYKLRMKETWFIWVIFIVFHTWLQNLFWTNGSFSLNYIKPNLSNFRNRFRFKRKVKEVKAISLKPHLSKEIKIVITVSCVVLILLLIAILYEPSCKKQQINNPQQKSNEEKQIIETQKIQNVNAHNGEVMLGSVTLFRGVTKAAFEKEYGIADRILFNHGFHPTTIYGHSEICDVYIYDKIGITLIVKPQTDSLMSMQLILKHTTKDQPQTLFSGNIQIGPIQVRNLNDVQIIKNSPNTKYYCYRGKFKNIQICYDNQVFTIFKDTITNEIKMVEFNFERNSRYNDMGWSNDDEKGMELLYVPQIESALKQNGFSKVSQRAISLCTIQKLMTSIVSGKYQDMTAEETANYNDKMINSCITENRYLEKSN